MLRCLVVSGAALATACSPTLDWREVRPDGSGMVALLPCKPSTRSRTILLAGAPVEMTLLACSADGALWGIVHGDVKDPGRVTEALQELGTSIARNVGGEAEEGRPLQVEGMTPNPRARRMSIAGRRADGTPVAAQAAIFAKGTRVFQVSVMGPAPDLRALDTFFGALRLPT